MTAAVLTLATLLTSLISGVLSMAGGLILMGVFGFLLSVPAAMVLHGVAQAASNGSRVWLYRAHIRPSVLIPYSIGAATVLAAFVALAFVPDKGVMFILIGLFPFAALLMPKRLHVDIEKPAVALVCGVLVTTAQMLAGASGPVLDVFYVGSRLTRYEVLATKGVTQTLGHIIKLGYYGFLLGGASFVGPDPELALWLFPAVIVAAITGNWLGKHIVDRLHDDQFRTWGRYIIMVIGVAYIAKGMTELG